MKFSIEIHKLVDAKLQTPCVAGMKFQSIFLYCLGSILMAFD